MFGWGATFLFLAIVLAVIVAFWVWWALPSRGRAKSGSAGAVDATDSKERLDLLRAARRWGDVSSTSDSYLRRERRHTV
ncbi:MAG TPA: hypothetical protein VF115_04115 [Acidimicrobiia bacterium]